VASGDVYEALLRCHFISAPSMMIRREVLEVLGGYDETLSYEDFDFWLRSSRLYKYVYSPKILVKKRILNHSLSSYRYQKKNSHIPSTASVCEKALKLNRSKAENAALSERCHYEIKWALATENWEAGQKLLDLINQLEKKSRKATFYKMIIKMKPPVYWLTKNLISLRKAFVPNLQ
jgi:hypothetical protein